MDCGTLQDIAPLAASGAALATCGNDLERSGGPRIASPVMWDAAAAGQ
jgi:hypothetical protein